MASPELTWKISSKGYSEGVNGILVNGDLLDFYKGSRFEQDPRKRGLMDEIEMAREFLRYLRSNSTALFTLRREIIASVGKSISC